MGSGSHIRFGVWLSFQVVRLLPRTRLSRALGWLCDRPLRPALSRVAQRLFARAYGVDLTDVAPRQNAYPTFDAFFTRPLRPGARRISPAPVVSPADGRIVSLGPIDRGSRLRVKMQVYTADELIGESADEYTGGSYVVVYLAPGDYHRVHAPVDGHVDRLRAIAGDLYPVNTLGERHVPRLLARNARVVVFIDTPDLGRAAVVLVGALSVGRITVPMLPRGPVAPGDYRLDTPVHVRRGDEIGTFHLGSTVVLLIRSGVTLSHDIGRVQYGQGLMK